MLELGDKKVPSSSRTRAVAGEKVDGAVSVDKRLRSTLRRILCDGKMLAKHLALPPDELAHAPVVVDVEARSHGSVARFASFKPVLFVRLQDFKNAVNACYGLGLIRAWKAFGNAPRTVYTDICPLKILFRLDFQS
jgi:hypothetical protein